MYSLMTFCTHGWLDLELSYVVSFYPLCIYIPPLPHSFLQVSVSLVWSTAACHCAVITFSNKVANRWFVLEQKSTDRKERCLSTSMPFLVHTYVHPARLACHSKHLWLHSFFCPELQCALGIVRNYFTPETQQPNQICQLPSGLYVYVYVETKTCSSISLSKAYNFFTFKDSAPNARLQQSCKLEIDLLQ